jgi:hypothetical protein
MNPTDDRAAEGATGTDARPLRRPYVAPKIERLGTIGELTQGLGNNDVMDGGHPPGQNKSIISG